MRNMNTWSNRPYAFWKYFKDICQIPHGSGNTKQISDYLVQFAYNHHLECHQDEYNNVIIIKDASVGLEKVPPLILQGHMDMVCEKTPDNNIDMKKDSILPYEGNGLLKADRTTLGADDGIAIAYALALLDDRTLSHPRIEFIATSDEEIGLLGAAAIDLSHITGSTLINLDSEEEGVLIAGCAGGVTLEGTVPYVETKKSGLRASFIVSGLRGGHSGKDISRGRLNAALATARILYQLNNEVSFSIARIESGEKENSIPRYAECELLFSSKESFLEAGKKLQCIVNDLRNEYLGTDQDFVVSFKEESEGSAHVFSDNRAFFRFLLNYPNGVVKMSGEVQGLVETSLSLGILRCSEGVVHTESYLRSSKDSAKQYLVNQVTEYIEMFGGNVISKGDYPGWDYSSKSGICRTVRMAFISLFNAEPVTTVVHAGLECGLLKGKKPDLDCISFGPEMHNVHTVDEELDMASAERCYLLLLEVIRRLAEEET